MKIKNLLLPPCLAILLATPFSVLAGEWDQVRATAVAGDLNTVLRQMLAGPEEPRQQPDAIEDRNLNAAVVDLEQLQKEVARLADMLANGRNQNQTRGFQREINSLRGSIRDYTRNTVISPEVELLAERAAALLDELNGYYE
ncbi:MAG: hypothetical protein U9Q71_05430 [Pseudomonadota bacterium]|nr:hypothetical protein [Pseudomonadota bacterium]